MPLGIVGNLGNTTTGYAADYGGFGGSAYIGGGTGAGTGTGSDNTFVGAQQTAGGMFTTPGEPGVANLAYGFNDQGVWGPIEQTAPLATTQNPIQISTQPATGVDNMPLGTMGQGYTSPAYTPGGTSPTFTSPVASPSASPVASPIPTSIAVTPENTAFTIPTSIAVTPQNTAFAAPTQIAITPENTAFTIPTSVAVTPENQDIVAAQIQQAVNAGYTPEQWAQLSAQQQFSAIMQAASVPSPTMPGSTSGPIPRPPSGGGSSGGSGGGMPSGGSKPPAQQQQQPLLSIGANLGTQPRTPLLSFGQPAGYYPGYYPPSAAPATRYTPAQFSAMTPAQQAQAAGIPFATYAAMTAAQKIKAAQQNGTVASYTPAQFAALPKATQAALLGMSPAAYSALGASTQIADAQQAGIVSDTGSLFGGSSLANLSSNLGGAGPAILIGGGLLLVLMLAHRGKGKQHA